MVLCPSCRRRRLCLDGFTASEPRRRAMGSLGRRGEFVEERRGVVGGGGDKSGLLRYCRRRHRRSPRRVGDILEPSIVYTGRKHLGSKAE